MNEQFADHINWLGYNFKAYLRESLASCWNWSKVFTRCAVSFKFRLFHVKCRVTSFDLSSWSPQQILCSVQQTRSWLYHLLLVQWLTLWEEISKLHQRQPISLTESCGYRNEQQKSSISDSQNLLQLFLASVNHNYNSIELKTDWRSAVSLEWRARPMMVLGNVCKTVLRITEKQVWSFYLPKWFEWWKHEVKHKNHHSWHLILDLSQQTHAQGSFKARLAFCVLVNKLVPTGEGRAPF